MEFLLYKKMDNSRSNIDEKPTFAQIQSTVEMGSLEDRAVLEMERKSLVNPGSIAVKKSSFKLADGSSDVSSSQNAYVTRSCNGVIGSIKVVVFSTKLNILIIFGPVAIIVDKASGAHGWVFILSLAENLGFATEQLAFFTGPTELMISIYALKRGMVRVVQQSLPGSILSNMLLVLGSAFFCGGLVNVQRWSKCLVRQVLL